MRVPEKVQAAASTCKAFSEAVVDWEELWREMAFAEGVSDQDVLECIPARASHFLQRLSISKSRAFVGKMHCTE